MGMPRVCRIGHREAARVLRECACPHPEPKPQKPAFCVKCGFHLAPRWTCGATTIDAWLQRLEDSLPGEDLGAFREHVAVRELAGRNRFRFAYLDRDNLLEGTEEAVDLALYALLDVLRATREGRGEEDVDLALTAAAHAARAHSALLQLRDKRSGAP